MARIPPEELERLKAQVLVEQLVAADGVAFKAAGKDLLALSVPRRIGRPPWW